MLGQKHYSSLLLVIALLIAPIAIWGENLLSEQWQERLVIPQFEIEPDRHTSLFWSGTTLPPSIREDVTLGPAQNPILIYGTTAIPAGKTLTIEAGTKLYAQEFAGINVLGNLNIEGEENNPVVFESNEQHPDNQMWSGIIVASTGIANINNVKIKQAAPAFTCLKQSTAKITSVNISQGSMGFFTASPECELADSIIRGVKDGVVSIGVEPVVTNVQINAKRQYKKITSE